MAVEKRLKPAVIVQGMLFCGAALSVQNNCYCTRYVILWCCTSQFRNNSGSREKIETCSYCTAPLSSSGSREKIETAVIVQGMLFCCSSEITVAVEKRLKPAVILMLLQNNSGCQLLYCYL